MSLGMSEVALRERFTHAEGRFEVQDQLTNKTFLQITKNQIPHLQLSLSPLRPEEHSPLSQVEISK